MNDDIKQSKPEENQLLEQTGDQVEQEAQQNDLPSLSIRRPVFILVTNGPGHSGPTTAPAPW